MKMMSYQSNDTGDFDFTLDPKEEATADFVAKVGGELQRTFEKRKKQDKLTQQQLATMLDVDRSRIHRCLSGYNNLTLSTVAELAWAMDAEIDFSITCRSVEPRTCNFLTYSAALSPSGANNNRPAFQNAGTQGSKSANIVYGAQKWR
jgi:plasmid maintenance system antidote protein VapI